MIVDFSELPFDAYDAWESLSKSFLQAKGFRVSIPPARGVDNGCDMIVADQCGLSYLVSCKHFATSGRSVGVDDEQNISDRVAMRGLSGFIGVYSTVPSQGLINCLEGLKTSGYLREYHIFVNTDVELWLMQDIQMLRIYFPFSYSRLKQPESVVDAYVPLTCKVCGRDLLKNMQGWIFSVEELVGEGVVVKNVLCACKGQCIYDLERELYRTFRGENISFPSEEVFWYNNSTGYFWRQSRIFNEVRSGQRKYTDTAWNEEQSVFLALSQISMRGSTTSEREMIGVLAGMS